MKSLKPLTAKRPGKSEREKEVLLGLIEQFIATGKPVGSNTLKDAGFDQLSSATIRNYFAKLENEGYLHQQHTSGGRIPTEKAFRFYANEFADAGILEETLMKRIEKLKESDSREVAALIRSAIEELSNISGMAAFISAPRFDRDFIISIKVVPIDRDRTLCILVTDFGSIHTEVVATEQKLTTFSAKRIESYLHWRMTGQDKPDHLEPEEEALGHKFYNEVMVRFLVGHTNFIDEDVHRTGYSNLLQQPEFRDPQVLAESLSLFENSTGLRHLLRDTVAHRNLRIWVGSDLHTFGAKSPQTTVLAMPYLINNQTVGAFGIIGPLRLPYRELFGILRALSQTLSESLTKNLYKFKLTYRQPQKFRFELAGDQFQRIEHKPVKLIGNRYS